MKRALCQKWSKFKRCEQCGRTSRVNEERLNLMRLACENLTTRYSSVEQALHEETEPELMSGDNKVTCEHCSAKTTHHVWSCLTHMPDTLAIQLRRFKFGPSPSLARLPRHPRLAHTTRRARFTLLLQSSARALP